MTGDNGLMVVRVVVVSGLMVVLAEAEAVSSLLVVEVREIASVEVIVKALWA